MLAFSQNFLAIIKWCNCLPVSFFVYVLGCVSLICYFDNQIAIEMNDIIPLLQGSAEVVYTRRSDAFAALKRYNNVLLDGKPMRIEIVGSNAEMPVARVNVAGLNGRKKRTVVMTYVFLSSCCAWLVLVLVHIYLTYLAMVFMGHSTYPFFIGLWNERELAFILHERENALNVQIIAHLLVGISYRLLLDFFHP